MISKINIKEKMKNEKKGKKVKKINMEKEKEII
jgi:hypothetical protein